MPFFGIKLDTREMCGVAGRNFYAQNLGLKFFGARDDPSRVISILYGMSIGLILFAVARCKLFLSKNAKYCHLSSVSNFPSLYVGPKFANIFARQLWKRASNSFEYVRINGF